MKRMQMTGVLAMLFTLAAFSTSAQLFKTKITATQYKAGLSQETLDKTVVPSASLIAVCTSAAGAQLVTALGTNGVPEAILVVDQCGSNLCDVATITTECLQGARVSDGTVQKNTIAARFTMNLTDGSTGDGFISVKASVDPLTNTDVFSYSAKGTFTLCGTNGENVVNGTLTIGGEFKPAKGCP